MLRYEDRHTGRGWPLPGHMTPWPSDSSGTSFPSMGLNRCLATHLVWTELAPGEEPVVPWTGTRKNHGQIRDQASRGGSCGQTFEKAQA